MVELLLLENWGLSTGKAGIHWDSLGFHGIEWYVNGDLSIFSSFKWWVLWGYDMI